MPGFTGWPRDYYGGFEDYREKAARMGRRVPVFRLTPRAASGGP